jgi:DNA-binding Xre family transcriptional regulator
MTPVRLRLRELRDARGWTQAKLAREADLRQATISELETGSTQGVAFDTLDKLASALGVEPGDLLERDTRVRLRRRR